MLEVGTVFYVLVVLGLWDLRAASAYHDRKSDLTDSMKRGDFDSTRPNQSKYEDLESRVQT